MAIIPVDSTHALLMLQNDAQQMRTFIQWVGARYNAYNQNLSTGAQMTAAGISVTADQNTVTAFIGDLNRLLTLMGGTLPGSATNMTFDLQAVLGIM
jgi:hypothetical protein